MNGSCLTITIQFPVSEDMHQLYMRQEVGFALTRAAIGRRLGKYLITWYKTMSKNRDALKKRLEESFGKVIYTYTAHWKIVDRLQKRATRIKIAQIFLTAISSAGVLAAVISHIPALSWIGGAAAAISLGLNLYSLNFNLENSIRAHTSAANELWDVREAYLALITDFDDLQDDEIRTKRDQITAQVSRINKQYPGTDKKSYAAAQRAIQKEEEQFFSQSELQHLLNISGRE